MPPLVMLGRKWLLGSDDFVYPTLIDLAIRVVRLVFAYIWLWKNWNDFPCVGSIYTTVYYVGFSGIVQLIVIVNMLIIYKSGQGGIMESEKRKYMPELLFIRLVLQVVELVWTSLGTSWLARDFFKCEGSTENIGNVDGTITANWVFIGLFAFFAIVNLLGSTKLDRKPTCPTSQCPDPQMLPYKETASSKAWVRFWKIVFCSFTRKNALVQEGFKQIGQIASYFFDDFDLVPSDVVVGLAVTSVKQKKKRTESLEVISNGMPQTYLNLGTLKNGVPNSNPSSKIPSELLGDSCWNSFSRIHRFHHYAIAIHYYLAIYLQRYNLCNVLKKQVYFSTKYLCCKKEPFVLKGDRCCFCCTSNLASFLERSLDDRQTTLVHVSFMNNYFKLPYMVVIDHLTKSIVIAIRGTMSRDDVFTDFVADAALMNMVPGVPSNFKCHNGFLHSAAALKRKLDKCKVVAELMNTFPTYNLVTTGISLGAGTSVILAMMYRSKYPNVKCFAYSSPSSLSFEAGEYCNDFVQSLIYGSDMVSRLSVRSAKNLLHEIKSSLQICKTPKYQIQWQMMLKTFRLRKRIKVQLVEESSQIAAQSRSTSEISVAISTSSILPVEHNYGSSFKYVLPQDAESTRSQLCPLYPPGKVLHITPSKLFREGHGELTSPNGPRWNIRWAARTEFDEIVVRKRLFLDHLPSRLHRALNYFESLQKTRGCIQTIS